MPIISRNLECTYENYENLDNLSFDWLKHLKLLLLGLEIGVCGGWVFTKTRDICVHGSHEDTWYFISSAGLQQDKTFRVKEACEQPSDRPPSQTSPSSPPRAYSTGYNYRWECGDLSPPYRVFFNLSYVQTFPWLHRQNSDQRGEGRWGTQDQH